MFNSCDRLCGTGTFRARDLSFPRTNSPYGQLSFLKLFIPRERKFRSLDLSFQGTSVYRTFHSQDFSFPGTFVPPTILQSINYEAQTAVTTVRICFVVGLVLFVYCVYVLFFPLNKNARCIKVTMPVDILTLTLGLPQVPCAPCQLIISVFRGLCIDISSDCKAVLIPSCSIIILKNLKVLY